MVELIKNNNYISVANQEEEKVENLSKEEEEKKILKYLTIQICPLRCNNNGLIQPPK
jgi:hypothetical protein